MITKYKTTLIETLINHLIEQGGEITLRGKDRNTILTLRREVRGFCIGTFYIRLNVNNPCTDYHKELFVVQGSNLIPLYKLINKHVFKETLERAIAEYDGLEFPSVNL